MTWMLPILFNAILVVIMYVISKETAFSKLDYKYKQIIIGVLFGCVAMLATEWGMDLNGAIVNVRDAAPICAGLIFGGPAGIISGVLGGVYRYLAVFWGAGEYTRMSCTIATILAGILAALMKKYMFENKIPTLVYGIFIAIVIEVTHMMMVFITNMNDVNHAFLFVRQCSIPMILGNAVAVGLAIFMVSLLNHERFHGKKKTERISQTFQRWLLLCIVIACVITSLFTYDLQSDIAFKNSSNQISIELADVEKKILTKEKEGEAAIDEMLLDVTKHRHIGTEGFIATCDGDMNLITDDPEYAGKNLREVGIDINPDKMKESYVYEAKIQGDVYYYQYKYISGHYIIGALPEDEAMISRDASVYLSVFMQILVFASLFILIYFLIKRIIINNLHKINESLEAITDGNLNTRVNVRGNVEFASLSDDINTTVDTLKQYIEEAAARIDKELEYAKSIQTSAIPSVFPPYPEQDNFDIYAKMTAAREVGGDFYDFYRLEDNKVAILIADVSGKGIPAAMFMMTSKTIIKDLAESGLDANEIFTKANEKLCENNETGMFVTAWMGLLDLETGVMNFANAGHNPPVIISKDGEIKYLKTRPGFVLAGMEGIRYKAQELTLSPGDRILLYTDGVTEAINGEDELYGEDRLLEYIDAHRTDDIDQVLLGLKEDIDRHAGETPQFDDITMLLMEFKKMLDSKNLKEAVFPASEPVLPEVLSFVENALEEIECPMKVSMQMVMAVEEVFINIAKYAYPEGGGKARLRLRYEPEENRIHFRIFDRGVQFNPLEREDPDITLSVDERDIGGLGIYMCKKTMDEITYEYEDGMNVLTMIKNL